MNDQREMLHATGPHLKRQPIATRERFQGTLASAFLPLANMAYRGDGEFLGSAVVRVDLSRPGVDIGAEVQRRMSLIGLLLSLLPLGAVLWPNVQAVGISVEASSHLEEIISVLEKEWLYRARMDWKDFRRQVFQRAGAAKTVPETYDAIRLALSLLGDKHSYYIAEDGKPIFNPASPTQSTGECTPKPAVPPSLPPDVAYVRIAITPAPSPADIQDVLRKNDRPGIVGWILDLRNSRGGNMWPVVTGIGPLLGEGIAGFFVDADKTATPWGYTDGKAWLGEDTVAQAERPYTVRVSNSRLAVLTDSGVASSGEAIAIGFRGRPNTRSFGTPTCGLSTAVQQFPLKRDGEARPFSESARIAVVTSVMADRTRREYGGAVTPDETVMEATQVVSRAVEWLRRP